MKMNFNFAALWYRQTGFTLLTFLSIITSTPFVGGQSSSNCVPMSGAVPSSCMTSKIAFVVMIDNAFVQQHGSVALARDKALDLIGSAAFAIQEECAIKGYLVEINLVNFTSDLGLDSWNTSNSTLFSNIAQYWGSANKSCIKKHGIIYLTGQSISGGTGVHNGVRYCENGFRKTSIAVVTNRPNDYIGTATTLAHEIMHGFGLKHLDENISQVGFVPATTCGIECASYPPLMCTSSGSYQLTSCDRICLNLIHNQTNCPCLNDESLFENIPEISDPGYICPPGLSISFLNHNPHPIKNCLNMDEMSIDISLRNDNQQSNRNIRLFLIADEKDRLELIPESCQDNFGSQICFSNAFDIQSDGREEYRILKSDGSEQTYNLGPGESVTVRGRFRYTYTGTHQFPNSYKFNIRAYTGESISDHTTLEIAPAFEVDATPMETLSSILSQSSLPSWPIMVKGRLIVDLPVYDFSPTKAMFFNSGAQIEILNGSVKMNNMQMEGCEEMWRGIHVREGDIQVVKTVIKDAQNAIVIRKGVNALIQGSCFVNNDVAIRPTTGLGANHNVSLLGNFFATTESGLKLPYSGQSPLPLLKGFAGLFLENGGVFTLLNDPVTGMPNWFSNLKYGIIAKNVQLSVGNAVFEDIVQVAKGTGYESFISGPTGKAIYAENGLIWVNNEDGQPVQFNNCHTGVETTGSTAYVWNTEMNDVHNGIITTNGNYSVHQNNTIEAIDRGIELRYASPLGIPNSSNSGMAIGGVYANAITLSGNPNGLGINTAGDKMIGIIQGGGVTSPPQFTGGNIARNTITLQEGANAIQVNSARKLSVWNNTATLANAQGASRGIALNGGDQNAITCNNVSGSTGGHTGLFALHADRAQLYCNHSAGSGTGLRVEGMLVGKAKADIAGNILDDNASGLLYGMDAISGAQTHRGNRWTGSGTVAVHQGDVFTANLSKYIVDATEDPEFLPLQRSPFTWFEDISDQEDSYTCPAPAGTCLWIEGLTGPSTELQLDRITAQGTFPGSVYTTTNNWLAQRRLYERILEDGNPYPGDTIITNFISAAQTNGLAGYAAMQVAIRAAMAVGQSDQETLQGYEEAILEGLDSLAVLENQLHTPYISEEDSADLSEQRLELLDSIQAYAAAKALLTAHLDSLRAVAAGVLLTQNNNLSDLEEPSAAHEKAVNGVLLRSVLRNIFTFSSQDSTTLEGIAELCPLSDGEAVLWARALLTLVTEAPRNYPDDTTCAVLERSRPAANTAGKAIRVYPNPATDKIIVEYHASAGTVQTFLLFNALGQLTKSVVLPGGNSPVQVPLDQIPAGIYYYGVSGAGTSMYSGKVIIKH